MTATGAMVGWGCEVFLGTSTDTATLIQLEEVIDFPFPEDQVADIEATHFLSPNKRKEYISGLIDGGTGDVVVNRIPGNVTDALLRAALGAGDARAFRVKELQSDGTYWQIDTTVIVKGYKRTAPIDNRKTATATLRFTGASSETDV
jgi:hypothetical protein